MFVLHVSVLALCFLGINSEKTLCDVCLKECSGFSAAINELKGDIEANAKEIEGMKKGQEAVAFYAYLSKSLSLKSVSKHTTIKYDNVDLNIGNGYDKKTGIFTAPSNGLYVFNVATGARDRSHSCIELAVNGVVKDIAWADSMDHSDRAFATTATPVSLNTNDKVLARIGELHGGKVLESSKNIRTSFSGFKINSRQCSFA